jgi:hypothetical protein
MKSREHFEAWFEEWFGDKPLSGWNELWCGDGYSSETIDAMWASWQASRQAVEIEIPERHYFCDNDGAFVDVSEVIYEVQQAGLKVKV